MSSGDTLNSILKAQCPSAYFSSLRYRGQLWRTYRSSHILGPNTEVCMNTNCIMSVKSCVYFWFFVLFCEVMYWHLLTLSLPVFSFWGFLSTPALHLKHQQRHKHRHLHWPAPAPPLVGKEEALRAPPNFSLSSSFPASHMSGQQPRAVPYFRDTWMEKSRSFVHFPICLLSLETQLYLLAAFWVQSFWCSEALQAISKYPLCVHECVSVCVCS